MTTLYLFDLDGTLCENNMTEPMPGVRAWFAGNVENHPDDRYAICSNQGGVGMRYWCESQGFGDPSQYPTEAEVRERLDKVVEALGVPIQVYVCFAYQAKKSGRWSPTPPGCETLFEWQPVNRKPNVGMINMARSDFAGAHDGVLPDRIIFIGDGAEDMGAADAAGVEFVTANTFFGWDPIPF